MIKPLIVNIDIRMRTRITRIHNRMLHAWGVIEVCSHVSRYLGSYIPMKGSEDRTRKKWEMVRCKTLWRDGLAVSL